MADIKISELTALTNMNDSALVPVVDGATTKKVTGLNLKTYFLNGNAATVTNGVYTTGSQTIGGAKTFSDTIIGDITGNAGTVTNGVITTGSYSDPSWITSLSYSKITNFPLSVVRAQRAAGGATPASGNWTFTTIKGSATGTFIPNGTTIGLPSNSYIIFTLTGFTEVPSVAMMYDNEPMSSGGLLDSPDAKLGELSLLDNITSGAGILSPGNPNLLTTFTPNTHKIYYTAQFTDAADFYFYFRQ